MFYIYMLSYVVWTENVMKRNQGFFLKWLEEGSLRNQLGALRWTKTQNILDTGCIIKKCDIV